MLLSVPLWAIIVTQMCSNWTYYTLLTSLPTYMDNVLQFDLKSVRFRLICFTLKTTADPIYLLQFQGPCIVQVCPVSHDLLGTETPVLLLL